MFFLLICVVYLNGLGRKSVILNIVVMLLWFGCVYPGLFNTDNISWFMIILCSGLPSLQTNLDLHIFHVTATTFTQTDMTTIHLLVLYIFVYAFHSVTQYQMFYISGTIL